MLSASHLHSKAGETTAGFLSLCLACKHMPHMSFQSARVPQETLRQARPDMAVAQSTSLQTNIFLNSVESADSHCLMQLTYKLHNKQTTMRHLAREDV